MRTCWSFKSKQSEVAKAIELLDQRLQKATQLGDLRIREITLQNQRAAQDHTKGLLAPDLERLQRHRETEPWSQDLTRLSTLHEAGLRAKQEVERSDEELTKARQEWLIGLEALCGLASESADQLRAALGIARKKSEDLAGALQEADQWLQLHSADAALDTKLPELLVQLEQLTNSRHDCTRQDNLLGQLTAQTKDQQNLLVHARSVFETAQSARATAEVRRQESNVMLNQLLRDRLESDLQQSAEAMRERVACLQRLIEIQTDLERRHALVADRSRKLAAMAKALPVARNEFQAAEQALSAARNEVALRRDHLNKSQLVASFEEHRSRLKPGESCPLCGALEHPLMEGHAAAPALDELTDALKKSELACNTAEKARHKASTQLNKLEANHSTAREDLELLQKDVEGITERIRGLAAQLQLTGISLPSLNSELATSQDKASVLRRELDEIAKVRAQLTACEKAVARAEADAQAARLQTELFEKQIAGLMENGRVAAERVQQCNAHLLKIQDQLQAELQPYLIPLPESGAEQVLSKSLSTRKTTYRERLAARERALAGVTQSKAELTELEVQLQRVTEKSILVGGQHKLRLQDSEPSPREAARLKTVWKTLDIGEAQCTAGEKRFHEKQFAADMRLKQLRDSEAQIQTLTQELEQKLRSTTFKSLAGLNAARLTETEVRRIQVEADKLQSESDRLKGALEQVQRDLARLRENGAEEAEKIPELKTEIEARRATQQELAERIGALEHELSIDAGNRKLHAEQASAISKEEERLVVWTRLHGLIGASDGRKFRRFAQGLSLDVLVYHANKHLKRLTDRYGLRRCNEEELDLEIEDFYQAGARRPTASLSGGESFLASLALALGLADLAGRNTRIDSLFIDEGFGSLDTDSLDVAISALETLRQNSKMIGVISHVPLLNERISTRIVVERLAGGSSTLSVARM